jgi:hypothetical protein
MEGKIALEEHFSTDKNNKFWNAKGEEDRNGRAYGRHTQLLTANQSNMNVNGASPGETVVRAN